MARELVQAAHAGEYLVTLRFDDGMTASLDISRVVPFEGDFAPLHDPAYVALANVDEMGNLCWPNGAMIDAPFLYAHAVRDPASLMRRF